MNRISQKSASGAITGVAHQAARSGGLQHTAAAWQIAARSSRSRVGAAAAWGAEQAMRAEVAAPLKASSAGAAPRFASTRPADAEARSRDAVRTSRRVTIKQDGMLPGSPVGQCWAVVQLPASTAHQRRAQPKGTGDKRGDRHQRD